MILGHFNLYEGNLYEVGIITREGWSISYSYITSRSRISLLLHEAEGEAQGRVLITMISYNCL